MIFGNGIDLVDVKRIQKQIESESGLEERVFTSDEIKYCKSKRYSAQHFAARFAAKEAFFKAIGIGWRNGLAFIQIEICNDELGKPSLVLHSKAKDFIKDNNITGIQVSLSHTRDQACAIVTLEK
ncbi:MAG: holo-[acyl-carrier-protein] synthase [Candidatus Zixiibacteriota bacterium]|nr:MAG: holo-[acyl-carrier-protein] synthase [candidate division Zixibacteria bacterium]